MQRESSSAANRRVVKTVEGVPSGAAAAKRREHRQKRLTDTEYLALLLRQGGRCAICGNPPKNRRLHVDHDHRTGTVRGLLCFRCNRALPNYVTEEWLRQALAYLTA